MLEEKPACVPLELLDVALKHTGWMPPAYLYSLTVNDTSSFDLSALGEQVQVGRRHPAGVLKSDVKRLQRVVSRLFFQQYRILLSFLPGFKDKDCLPKVMEVF